MISEAGNASRSASERFATSSPGSTMFSTTSETFTEGVARSISALSLIPSKLNSFGAVPAEMIGAALPFACPSTATPTVMGQSESASAAESPLTRSILSSGSSAQASTFTPSGPCSPPPPPAWRSFPHATFTPKPKMVSSPCLYDTT